MSNPEEKKEEPVENPYFKAELVRIGSFDFWRAKLYDLRDAIYRHMDKTGTCPICSASANPHSEDCGFDKVERDIIEYARKMTGGRS